MEGGVQHPTGEAAPGGLRPGESCGSPVAVEPSLCASGKNREFGKEIAVCGLEGKSASATELMDGLTEAVGVLAGRQLRNDRASYEIAVAVPKFLLAKDVFSGVAAPTEDYLVESQLRVGAFADSADGFVEFLNALHAVDCRSVTATTPPSAAMRTANSTLPRLGAQSNRTMS